MLSKFRVQHYKSLFDVEVDLEPLTVFIGPNGSGKSNLCETLAAPSDFLHRLILSSKPEKVIPFFAQSLQASRQTAQPLDSKFWHGTLDHLEWTFTVRDGVDGDAQAISELSIRLIYQHGILSLQADSQNPIADPHTHLLKNYLVSHNYLESPLAKTLSRVRVYDFSIPSLADTHQPVKGMDKTGLGLVYALVDILHTNRQGFDELEARFTQLVPNIKRITLPRGENQTFSLALVDRYSDHPIPASDISDGTLRILAFLTALYQADTPSIMCFEEPENGVHPWLLHKMMELLKTISTEGITGQPVQILITTHSPVLLNYVEPQQVRAVELDHEGKTQVHALPVESARFQKALEAYDGELGELWFTNVFGGNPE